MRTYTFVCLAGNQVAVTVDRLAADTDAYRAHVHQLFRDHAAVAAIEVWDAADLVESLSRDGIRPWPDPAGRGRDDGGAGFLAD